MAEDETPFPSDEAIQRVADELDLALHLIRRETALIEAQARLLHALFVVFGLLIAGLLATIIIVAR